MLTAVSPLWRAVRPSHSLHSLGPVLPPTLARLTAQRETQSWSRDSTMWPPVVTKASGLGLLGAALCTPVL